ncbi:MAG: hypothetical protein ABW159_16930, partial [Candidatus Thiodiazotropha sp.]
NGEQVNGAMRGALTVSKRGIMKINSDAGISPSGPVRQPPHAFGLFPRVIGEGCGNDDREIGCCNQSTSTI